MSEDINKREFELPENSSSSKNENEQIPNKEDVNDIIPSMGVISKPIIFLVGPKSSGKTVTLLRLAKYFRFSDSNYTLKPNKNFRKDERYAAVCETFTDLIENETYAPPPTVLLDFLLVDVFENKELVYHILEAPGEHYFDETNSKSLSLKPYLSELLFSNLKKIFIFTFVRGMFTSEKIERAYADRLAYIASLIRPKKGDKIIFVLNKVDLHTEQLDEGVVKANSVKEFIYNNINYNALIQNIKKMRNLDPVIFVPFSSGKFEPTISRKSNCTTNANQNVPKKS